MSFNIGLSALSAAQEEIAVTGNNIANASTTGFKSSRAEFADVYAASVLGGSRQAGGGVSLQTIAQNFSQGNITYTDNTLDLAINGGGFFILGGTDGSTVYSRAGAFGTDKEGYIVNKLGEKLQGYPASGNGTLGDLIVTKGQISPKGTTQVNSTINLDAGASPSSIIGSKVVTNNGEAGQPIPGVRAAREAVVSGQISTTGTDFSGTKPAIAVGSASIAGGFAFNTAGGDQAFTISVNGLANTEIDLSGVDTANAQEVADAVNDQIALAPNLGGANPIVEATVDGNNRLALKTVAEGGNAQIFITSVKGLASNLVTEGTNVVGKTAPNTGFTITLDGISEAIEIDQDFRDTTGTGSGNEALEDYIQDAINGNANLAGRISVSINNLGKIEFKATESGASTLTVDPRYSGPGNVNFGDIVEFSTNRREGKLDTSNLNFSVGDDRNTSFRITVGGAFQVITLTENYSENTTNASALGDEPSSGLEAIEDEIQRQLDASGLPGAVKFSMGADGDFVFQITDPSQTSLTVASESTSASEVGSVDVTDGFDFATTPYTFTVDFDDGVKSGTSIDIELTDSFATGALLVAEVNRLLTNVNTGLGLTPTNAELVASINPLTGFLVIETRATGPGTSLELTVTLPNPAPASPVIGHSAGTAATGNGPVIDFASIATFTGSELSNKGADKVTNGYVAETIRVTNAQGNSQLVSISAGARANEIASQFSAIDGVSAKGTTVAFITGTNSGDKTNQGYSSGSGNDGSVTFTINGKPYIAKGTDHNQRMSSLETLINGSDGTLSAETVIVDGDNNMLKIIENNGNDLVFAGGTTGAKGSITVNTSVRNPDGIGFSVANGDGIQLDDLANLNNDAIVVGGIVDFTLDEGVTLADAVADANGNAIGETEESIFGDLSNEEALTGTSFELNTFDPDNPDSYYRSTAIAVFDSLGVPHTLTQYFVKERATQGDGNSSVWSVYFQIDGDDVGFDDGVSTVPSLAKATIKFNSSGIFESGQDEIHITNWTPMSVNGRDKQAQGPLPGATTNDDRLNSSNFKIDLSALTQFGGDYSVGSNTQDGYAAGELTGLEISKKGNIFARFSNGKSQELGQVALASFEDPSKLANIGGTRFAATAESGPGTDGFAGTAGRGGIESGALEDSNVDLSEQLVQLIVSQRNFQAAAQIIESIDTSTQTIINL